MKLLRNLVLACALVVGGCSADSVMVHTPDEIKAETNIAQQAQKTIENGYVLVISAANTISEYHASGAFTTEEAQRYALRIQEMHKELVRAEDLVRLGDWQNARDKAAIVNTMARLLMAELIKAKGAN